MPTVPELTDLSQIFTEKQQLSWYSERQANSSWKSDFVCYGLLFGCYYIVNHNIACGLHLQKLNAIVLSVLTTLSYHTDFVRCYGIIFRCYCFVLGRYCIAFGLVYCFRRHTVTVPIWIPESWCFRVFWSRFQLFWQFLRVSTELLRVSSQYLRVSSQYLRVSTQFCRVLKKGLISIKYIFTGQPKTCFLTSKHNRWSYLTDFYTII